MLRKHILGLAALVLGFGLVISQSAFTPETSSSTGKKARYTFNYQGPIPMTKADVVVESNWVHGEEVCPNGSDLACAIEIDGAYVDATTPTPTLKPTANLVSSSSNPAPVVTGSADALIQIFNRQD